MRENAEFRSSHRVPHRARRASAARAAIDGVLAALFLLQMAYLYLPIEAHETLGGMPGNVCFNFSVSIADPDTIYLTDAWEDEAAFKAHLFREETAVWAALKERYVEDSQLKEYDL